MREQAKTQWKKFGSSPIGEEAEVADAHEAAWQRVEQEAAQELIDRQSHNPLAVAVCGIAPSETDFAISKSKHPVVGDGDAVSVVSEIAQHVFRSTEGRLGIDHPVLAEQHSEPGREGPRIGERSELAVELKRSVSESTLECGDELAAEDTAEYLDGKEERLAG
jgi:hypothetical protein